MSQGVAISCGFVSNERRFRYRLFEPHLFLPADGLNAPLKLKLRAINLFPAGILVFQRANFIITTSDFTKAHIQPNTGACSSSSFYLFDTMCLSMIILHKVVDTQLDRKLNVQARLSLSGLNGKIF